MQNVTVNQTKYGRSGSTPISLNNGALVLHYNQLGHVIGAYMVTSFRDAKNRYKDDSTAAYCSLLNLDNGYLAFEERCSRSTTIARVLSHLSPGDYQAKAALRAGQYVEVHKPGTYTIDLITADADKGNTSCN